MTDKYETPQSNYDAQGGSANAAYPDLAGLVGEEFNKYAPLFKGLGPVGDVLLFDPKLISAMPEDYQKLLYAGIAYKLAQLKDQTATKPEYGQTTASILDALINMYADKAGIAQYFGKSSKDKPVYRNAEGSPLETGLRG
jgi:hypothetical protein